MEDVKVVLRQDGDCHWYLIPVIEASDFDTSLSKIEGKDYMDCPDDFDDFSESWEQFRTGGDPDLVPEYYKQNSLNPIK